MGGDGLSEDSTEVIKLGTLGRLSPVVEICLSIVPPRQLKFEMGGKEGPGYVDIVCHS
jgi:hypothetical protein